ncbi:glycoside hydrolase family 92 protein [Robertkochia marina]|uniref:Glycoside hydrolase family 92 protein n=1 Tax=Robertkochia marina TaxID=1227945 RepID=A0A4S3LZE8_9FLAO|nr:GH92 family glycosyl hydrolase [Robertkochia marina]THD66816.1 glycoside hydrolase family 92 protein [Robertkochia marina]TRZ40883.1 glycoside hydrolase family 92 protein [Robertkochia marina]
MKIILSGIIIVTSIYLSGCNRAQGNDMVSKAEVPVTNFVNPFIGTSGHGHTFPGATTPNGMVQLSPDTRTLGWDACGGYHYTDTSILGFSHTHLSGTGIGDMGDVLFMPFTGEAHIEPGSPENPETGYRSRFNHDTENAVPGYYTVELEDYNIEVELTASKRVGFHKYNYREGHDPGIIIDLAHTIHGHENTINEIKVISETEIVGHKKTKGWAQNHDVFFYAKFDRPVTTTLYVDGVKSEANSQVNGQNTQAVIRFEQEQSTPLLVKVGISSVDYEGAKKNLIEEVPDWDFHRIRNRAQKQWDDVLNKIKVKGGSADQKAIFYTSLYHTYLSPYVFNDVDGRYRGMNREIQKSATGDIYTVFSLWDTFRGYHPLQNILEPEKNAAFIRSLLDKYENGGILPKWELSGNYTGTMIGYHAVSVIADAYAKGNRDFDAEKALNAMVHAASYDTTSIAFPSENVKNKLVPKAKYYNETLGFIPADLENESVSKALEYAFNDWCIAQLANALGKEEIYHEFMKRSMAYKQYFDKETGFMRGVNNDGTFKEPFDPKFSRHRKDDYVEGNAWQWTWFVPHDVEGLVETMGGKEKFTEKLDELFSTDSEIKGDEKSSDITGLIGQYAHGNEPSHHISHLYNFVGQSWKTQQLTDSILNSLYFNDPNGLSGNEDCGQMSAWYILNALGFYSFNPGSSMYSIGRPIFDAVEIQLNNGKTFTILANNNSTSNKYVQSVYLNGEKLETPFFEHTDILEGGTLQFEMGPEKNVELFTSNSYEAL